MWKPSGYAAFLKYDAAGNAGIEYQTKKDKRFGTNGSVAAGYAIGRYTGISHRCRFPQS
jgi:hypothetical protein